MKLILYKTIKLKLMFKWMLLMLSSILISFDIKELDSNSLLTWEYNVAYYRVCGLVTETL